MNTVLPMESLQEIFDLATREVMKRVAGIHLHRGGTPPDGEVCTIYIAFENGVSSSLSMCAEKALLVRLTQNMMQSKQTTNQDVEDFSKEFFNVLCGQVAAGLYRPTRIASRIGIPAFYWGRWEPEGQSTQFALTYTSDQEEGAQLIHHISVPAAG